LVADLLSYTWLDSVNEWAVDRSGCQATLNAPRIKQQAHPAAKAQTLFHGIFSAQVCLQFLIRLALLLYIPLLDA
jgi:hypothetical protein